MFRCLVPGLLQTPDYIRAVVAAGYPDAAALEIDGRVELKVRRQALVTRSIKPVRMEVILHEGALRRVIGGRKVMSAQLRRLADDSTRPNIGVRVLPFAAGMPTGDQIGPFIILEFAVDTHGNPVEPTIVYAENYTGDMYSEKPSIVQRYEQAYDTIQRRALDEDSTRSLLRVIAREHERER